jgi:hypothetical protein
MHLHGIEGLIRGLQPLDLSALAAAASPTKLVLLCNAMDLVVDKLIPWQFECHGRILQFGEEVATPTSFGTENEF